MPLLPHRIRQHDRAIPLSAADLQDPRTGLDGPEGDQGQAVLHLGHEAGGALEGGGSVLEEVEGEGLCFGGGVG